MKDWPWNLRKRSFCGLILHTNALIFSVRPDHEGCCWVTTVLPPTSSLL